jgi:hypothetical protein
MSGRSSLIAPLRKFDLADISVLRYVCGATLAMAIALGVGWNLSHLLPVLAIGYFAPGAKPPTFKQGLMFLFTVIVSSFAALLFFKIAGEYIMAFIPGFALILLTIFHTNKLAPQNKLFVLVSFLLVPMLGFISLKVAYAVVFSIITGAVVTLILVWIVHAIIPDVTMPDKAAPAKPAPKPLSSDERLAHALNSLTVVLPLVLVFYFFQWSGGLLVLIFVAILSMNPAFNIKAGMALILGNLAGGIISIILYEMLVIVPQFFFLILLILLTGLFLGPKFFSGTKTAPLFGMAFSTVLLIIAQSTSGTDDAGEKVWIRVLQIMIAVIYVVLAFSIMNYFRQRRLA